MGEWWLRENGGYGRMVDVADVAIRCQAVDVARKVSTVWRTVATGKGGYGRMVDVADVAIRCQAVDVARKTTTVWRTVATGNGGYGRMVVMGEWWLWENGGCC
jgi:L-lactate permease